MSWRQRRRTTGVSCPRCKAGELQIHYACRRTWLQCEGCHEPYELGQLVPHLTDGSFERLVELVGDRLSDRV